MKIFKFGGKAMANPQSIKKVVAIIESERPDIIVVSAPAGITNILQVFADGFISNDRSMMRSALKEIHRIFDPILDFFSVSDVSEATSSMRLFEILLDEELTCNLKELITDAIVSRGEIMSAGILSAILSKNSFDNSLVPANTFISTDMNFGNANVLRTHFLRRLRDGTLVSCLKQRKPVVVEGFVGWCFPEDNGIPSWGIKAFTTLGREASDYTACLIPSGLREIGIIKDKEVEVILWKDVDGVILKGEVMETISFSDLYCAVNKGGFAEDLVHPKAVREVERWNIPLKIKNFNNPEKPGTIIS